MNMKTKNNDPEKYQKEMKRLKKKMQKPVKAKKTISQKPVEKAPSYKALYERNMKRWELVARGNKYAQASAKEACWQMVTELTEDLMDGCTIALKTRNSVKPNSTQRRIMRRIAEKKLAQKAQRLNNGYNSRWLNHCVDASTGDCMLAVRLKQICA